ncbi:type II toxin-antitoxin system RatA family toxin [Thioflexithrix psekupsensis]|uniref:Coenzyme Q-binding protein COQ10 START domain-containing protein n=1 Tax=Thioflexithrix psekupsensis TaxID=1570016 RepID=A0A251X922_9GAMM|nr:type II toxin-antitoxin system RatA family toxin [Thioflexithrix psekupsensis]OUD14022.1 hypothetical protein TPSD3_06680 [Thioflexithrix psekupsensis]
MKHIHKTALVPYSASNMYQLVNAIENYPQFLPWCKATEVHFRSETRIDATIKMGSIALGTGFTTRNDLVPNQSIKMELIEGPFKSLRGLWTFQSLGDDTLSGCKIALTMDFEISNPLLRKTLTPVFTQIVCSLIDAFIKRAHECYGKK